MHRELASDDLAVDGGHCVDGVGVEDCAGIEIIRRDLELYARLKISIRVRWMISNNHEKNKDQGWCRGACCVMGFMKREEALGWRLDCDRRSELGGGCNCAAMLARQLTTPGADLGATIRFAMARQLGAELAACSR